MKEYSFNGIMADWLTYEDNRSLLYNLRQNPPLETFPDENYAREIMQLFTIGLQEINMDGSVAYDEDGVARDTYDVDDVLSYSRAGTGLSPRDARGGAVDIHRNGKLLSLDPLHVEPSKRDPFPK